MKTRIITIACVGISNFLCHCTMAQQQTSTTDKPSEVYISLLGQLAVPQGLLKEYSNARGGLLLEAGGTFQKHQSFSAGVELSGIFSGSKEDEFKGLEVSTRSTFYELHPFLRWAPKKNLKLKPFVDVSSGLTVAYTSTTSTVVDEATFFEEVVLGEEDEVETTTHMHKTSANLSFSVGTGVIINKFIMIGVRYHHTNPLSYTDKNEVFVKNNKIQYNEKRIPLDMVVITVGLTIWGN